MKFSLETLNSDKELLENERAIAKRKLDGTEFSRVKPSHHKEPVAVYTRAIIRIENELELI